MQDTRIDRRTFLGAGLKGGIVALLGLPWFARSQPVAMATGKKEEHDIVLDFSSAAYGKLKDVGGAVYVPYKASTKPIVVWRQSETVVKAFLSACTHAGCRVGLPKDDRMVCPCHASVFDRDGRPTQGPAKRPLKVFDAELLPGKVVIKLVDA
jgi:Rieske Fe-S protein